MAIKNTLLGGTDWTSSDYPTAQDMNDTMDAAANLIKTSPCFWLNTELYDVYDDFNSYSTGAFTTNSLWNISETGQESGFNLTQEIQTTQLAGGTTQELMLEINRSSQGAGPGYIYAKAINLTANRHTFIKTYSRFDFGGGAGSTSGHTSVSFDGGTTYHTLYAVVISDDSDGNTLNQVFVVAKGSDEYDCYVGGKMVQNLTDASFEVWIRCVMGGYMNGNGYLAIDDVRQSKVDVE